jgi:RNA polymerase sigma-70 factor (ECF subfamily)
MTSLDPRVVMTSHGWSAALAEARLVWPQIELADDDFARAIAARIPQERAASRSQLDEAISRLHTADLYLADACARGDPIACTAFAELVGTMIARPVGAIVGTQSAIDDVRQIVCQRLLVAADGAPRIAGYDGTVRLGAWIRVIATRIAIDERRRQGRDRPLEDALVENLRAEDISPEIGHLKAKYGTQFKAAVEGAVRSLSHRDRGILRFTIEHNLTADEIGRIYDVHRVTVARWLRRIRDALSAQILRELGVEPAEVASMLRLIRSQISLSIERLLTS